VIFAPADTPVRIGERNIVFATRRAEDRPDVGLVFHSMQSKFIGRENEGAFGVAEVDDVVHLLK